MVCCKMGKRLPLFPAQHSNIKLTEGGAWLREVQEMLKYTKELEQGRDKT